MTICSAAGTAGAAYATFSSLRNRQRTLHSVVSTRSCNQRRAAGHRQGYFWEQVTDACLQTAVLSFQSIKQVITDGVPRSRDYEVPMPPKGGAPFTDSDVTAVAAYV
jgi:hypothetical protein